MKIQFSCALYVIGAFVISNVSFGGEVFGTRVELEVPTESVVLSFTTSKFYAAQREINRVAEHDLSSMLELRLIATGFMPRRLALSSDESTLYTTKTTSGSVTGYDLQTGELAEWKIPLELGDPRTYDVAVGLGDEIYVSSNPGSNGFAWIVRVDTSTGVATRVADDRIIRAAPTFELDPAGGFMYVGSGFSPNSLYKLDATLPNAPIVLEDDHGSIGGATISLSIKPDGSRILTGATQVIRTSNLTQAALLPRGASSYSQDGSVIAIFSPGNNFLNFYDATTFDTISEFEVTNCGFSSQETGYGLIPVSEKEWLLWNSNVVCHVNIDVIAKAGFE